MKPSTFLPLLWLLIIFTAACNKNPDPDKPLPCPACPEITALVPDHGLGGDTIELQGKNFGKFVEGESEVSINSKSAELAGEISDESLKVIVPNEAGTGPVIVKIGNLASDELSESPVFTYDFTVFNSIEPAQGKPGDVVLFHGNFFSEDPEANKVLFTGASPLEPVEAVVQLASENLLEVIIPDGGQSGPVTVEVAGHVAGGPEFEYKYNLIISSLVPSSGPKDTEITISGEGFDTDPGMNIATFEGGQEGEIISVSETELVVKVPTGAESGPINIQSGQLSGDTPHFTYEYTISVSTVVGTPGAPGSDNSKLNYPTGLTFDADGNMFIADAYNHKIRKYEMQTQTLSNYAGTGVDGNKSGAGHIAQFNFPVDVAADADGNIIVADYFNHSIRKISPSKMVTLVAGSGSKGYKDGSGATVAFNSPYGLAIDNQGDIFVADRYNHRIRKISTSGKVTTFVGSGIEGSKNGRGISAQFDTPNNLAFDPSGNLIVADYGNHLIRHITNSGGVTTIAGTGISGYSNGNGIAASAQFKAPYGTCVDANGNIYVSDKNYRIRLIKPDGSIEVLAGTGVIGHKDGDGSQAEFAEPTGMAIGPDGHIYVADAKNHVIRKITLE